MPGKDQFATVSLDDLFDLFLGLLAQAGSAEFGYVVNLQQTVHAPQFLKFTLVQDADPIANVLHVGQ